MHYILVGNGKMGRVYREYAEGLGDQCIGTYDADNIQSLQHAEKGRVLIDFSSPKSLPHIINYLHKHPIPFVCGTTGFGDKQLCQIKQLSDRMPVLVCANFSLGLAALYRIMWSTSDFLQKIGFTVNLTEVHHKDKVDIPSATALALAEIARIPKENIFSYRIGEVVGQHTITYTTTGETLQFSHIAQNRTVFAAGARMAAEKLLKCAPGLYQIEDLWEEG